MKDIHQITVNDLARFGIKPESLPAYIGTPAAIVKATIFAAVEG